MATKVNILKLLQESRGLAELTGRQPRNRLPGPLCLPLRQSGPRSARPKRMIRITMQDRPDIPHPVAIKHLHNTRPTD